MAALLYKIGFIGLCCLGVAPLLAQSAPRSVEAIPRSPDRITLYWLPPRGQSPVGYQVYLEGTKVAELPAEARLYDFTGLTPARPYTLAVEAVYANGAVSERVERTERPYRLLPPEARYPILIVGATASGVGAAITAARMGVKVALMEPTNRVGGMITNGVAVTDVRLPSRINGLYEEFRQRVEAYYKAQGADTTNYVYRNGLNFEPWVANMLLKEMIYAEPHIDLFRSASHSRYQKGEPYSGRGVYHSGRHSQRAFYRRHCHRCHGRGRYRCVGWGAIPNRTRTAHPRRAPCRRSLLRSPQRPLPAR
ncbi:MAG: hypothetical protein C4336_02045 [Armatimonadota bacterium]